MTFTGVDVPDDATGAAPKPLPHPLAQLAAKHFSTRVALTAMCFFFLATAGIEQMEAAGRKSVVTRGRYSLAETAERPWVAPNLRVGWKKADAYVGFSDYALLEALALGRMSMSIFMYLTPAAWFAALRLRQQADMAAEPGDENAASPEAKPPQDAWLVSPLAE